MRTRFTTEVYYISLIGEKGVAVRCRSFFANRSQPCFIIAESSTNTDHAKWPDSQFICSFNFKVEGMPSIIFSISSGVNVMSNRSFDLLRK